MSSQDDPEYNDDPYKFYFQIDTEWLKKYMDNLFKGINLNKLDGIENLFNYSPSVLPEGFKPISLPVSSWLSSIEGITPPYTWGTTIGTKEYGKRNILFKIN